MAKFRLADGRVVMRSTKARTRREALRIAWSWEDASLKARRADLTQAASTKILAELLEFSTGEQLQAPCIQSVVTDYLRSRDTLGRAESTARRYKPIVEGFLASLQEGRARAAVTSLTAQEIERWRDLEVKAGKAAKTVNVGLGVIRAALNACRRKGLILHNPAEAVEPVAGQADERVPFTDEEVRSLLRAAKDADWEGAVLVGVWTGLRLADVASLTWEAVDLDQSLMLVTPMKTGRPLAVAMAPELRDYMTKRKQAAEGRDVFPKLAGRRTGSNGATHALALIRSPCVTETTSLTARGSFGVRLAV